MAVRVYVAEINGCCFLPAETEGSLPGLMVAPIWHSAYEPRSKPLSVENGDHRDGLAPACILAIFIGDVSLCPSGRKRERAHAGPPQVPGATGRSTPFTVGEGCKWERQGPKRQAARSSLA